MLTLNSIEQDPIQNKLTIEFLLFIGRLNHWNCVRSVSDLRNNDSDISQLRLIMSEIQEVAVHQILGSEVIRAVASERREERQVLNLNERVEGREREAARDCVGEQDPDENGNHVRGLANDLKDDHRYREGASHTARDCCRAHYGIDAFVYKERSETK